MHAGRVWPAVPGGGPAGTLPPHDFVLYFLAGGIGTFYPLYYTLAQRAKAAFAQRQQQQPRPAPIMSAQDLNPPDYVQGLVSQA